MFMVSVWWETIGLTCLLPQCGPHLYACKSNPPKCHKILRESSKTGKQTSWLAISNDDRKCFDAWRCVLVLRDEQANKQTTTTKKLWVKQEWWGMRWLKCGKRNKDGRMEKVNARATCFNRYQKATFNEREHNGMRVHVFISHERESMFHFNRYSNLFVYAIKKRRNPSMRQSRCHDVKKIATC